MHLSSCRSLESSRWFATRPRLHVHFTPTYASWLNQVEIWFNRITQQAIRRGTFSSVKELVEKIDHYIQNSNRRAQPFSWTATADSSSPRSRDYAKVFTGQHTRINFSGNPTNQEFTFQTQLNRGTVFQEWKEC